MDKENNNEASLLKLVAIAIIMTFFVSGFNLYLGLFLASLILYPIIYLYAREPGDFNSRLYRTCQDNALKKGFTFKTKQNREGFIAYNKNILIELEWLTFKVTELKQNPKTLTIFTEYYTDGRETTEFMDFLRYTMNKFSKHTTYNDFKRDTQRYNFSVFESKPKEYAINSQKKEIQEQPLTIEFNLKKIDINNASAQELASFPGISIVQAKKAVKYRDLHNGFKEFSEFAKVVKIKNMFISKVRPYVVIGDYNKISENNDNIGRVVDF